MEEYANIMAEDEEIEEPEIYDTVEDVELGNGEETSPYTLGT